LKILDNGKFHKAAKKMEPACAAQAAKGNLHVMHKQLKGTLGS
jgi:hypothetical protein